MIVRYTYAWFATILSGSALAFVIGPTIVTWVAGANYEGAGKVVGWLILGQVFGGMYLMVTNYIFYAKKTGPLAAVTLFAGLINVLLIMILVPRWGIIGAATSFGLAMGCRFCLTWWIAHHSYPMPWGLPLIGNR